MTRVLSGVALAATALALLWFLSSTALLGVALVVCALAFHEYEQIVDRIGAKVPYWTALLTTLLACAMVPFQWFDITSVLGLSLLLVALNVLASDRTGRPLLADTAAAMLAPVYLGLPLGSLVGVHAMAGKIAVLMLIATVAVSDTAQFYTGRAFGKRPLAPTRSPKKTQEGAIGGFIIAPLFMVVAGHYFLPEYAWRPSGIVCYSAGPFGGVRAAMQLRAMLCELGMPSIPSLLPIPKVQDAFEDDGEPRDPAFRGRSAKFFGEFEWYAEALKRGRAAGVPY